MRPRFEGLLLYRSATKNKKLDKKLAEFCFRLTSEAKRRKLSAAVCAEDAPSRQYEICEILSSCANEIKFDLSNADYAESICENYVSQLLATGKQGLYARPDISNLQNFMISRPARCYRPSKKSRP